VVVDRFSITPFGLDVVVVVVVSDEVEGGGTATGADCGTVPYSVVVVVSLAPVGPQAVKTPAANAATDMIIHDLIFCILYSPDSMDGTR
jgi:hypothetical protein